MRRVTFYVDGDRLGTDGRSPFRKRIARGSLNVGELSRLRARVTMDDARVVSVDRLVRACP